MSGRTARGRAILALAPNAWEGPWMNRQQLLSRLAAAGVAVLYSTGQWRIWDRGDPEWRSAPAWGCVREANGVWVDEAPRWLLRFPGREWLDRPSLALGCRRLRRLMTEVGGPEYTLIVYHPMYQPYAARLGAERIIYHAYDLFERAPDWSPALAEQEDWLLAHADLCIASSRFSADRLQERSGREVRHLPNGAHVAAFQQARESGTLAPELAAIPRPRIGYVGRLNRKVDLPLIADLAERRPNWHFVLLGPVDSLDEVTAAGLERCRARDNVHEMGARPHDELPTWVAGMDVALMPYRTGPGLWTDAIYPLKLHEYLAADRPVVSTELPALQPFADVLEFANDAPAWEAAIERSLSGDGKGACRRVETAMEHDWSVLAERLRDWLTDLERP